VRKKIHLMNYEMSVNELANEAGAQSPEGWVHEVLEPDQLTSARTRYGRKKLGVGTLVLLWGLRVYVVFMICIIALAVWNTLHAG
jgi:hypothetical protein